MTRNSQHGTQKPSAWYALGLKMVLLKRNMSRYFIWINHQSKSIKTKSFEKDIIELRRTYAVNALLSHPSSSQNPNLKTRSDNLFGQKTPNTWNSTLLNITQTIDISG